MKVKFLAKMAWSEVIDFIKDWMVFIVYITLVIAYPFIIIGITLLMTIISLVMNNIFFNRYIKEIEADASKELHQL